MRCCVTALLRCFTLLYHCTRAHPAPCLLLPRIQGARHTNASVSLCFTLLYSALLWLTSADTGRKTKASALLALCSTSSFRRSAALLCFTLLYSALLLPRIHALQHVFVPQACFTLPFFFIHFTLLKHSRSSRYFFFWPQPPVIPSNPI